MTLRRRAVSLGKLPYLGNTSAVGFLTCCACAFESLVALCCCLGRVGSHLPLPSLAAAAVFPVPTDRSTPSQGSKESCKELSNTLLPALDLGPISCHQGSAFLALCHLVP